jgi:hypothetical protein
MKPTLRATVPMPGVEGRVDHPAMDVKTRRLLHSAPGNNMVVRSRPGMNESFYRWKERAGYDDAGNVRYGAAHRRMWVSYDEGGISAVDIAIGEPIMFANAPDACRSKQSTACKGAFGQSGPGRRWRTVFQFALDAPAVPRRGNQGADVRVLPIE